jgi:hypothetical protein
MMSKSSELANLGSRQNLCHDFRLFGTRVDHHNSIEPVAREVTSDFFPVAMLLVAPQTDDQKLAAYYSSRGTQKTSAYRNLTC